MLLKSDPWVQGLTKPEKKKHKYGAKKTVVDGQSFPSKLEADVFCYLKMMQSGGYIEGLERYASLYLSMAKIAYKPDFQAFHKEHNAQVYYEAKGMETERWRLVKRLWKVYGPGRLFVFKGNSRGVYLAEEIIPERAA